MRPGRLSRHVPLFSHAHHYRYYSVDLRAGLGRGSTSKWICGGWCIEICKMDEGKYLVMTRAIKCSVQSVKMSFSCNHNLFVHYYNCLKKNFFCWFKVFLVHLQYYFFKNLKSSEHRFVFHWLEEPACVRAFYYRKLLITKKLQRCLTRKKNFTVRLKLCLTVFVYLLSW